MAGTLAVGGTDQVVPNGGVAGRSRHVRCRRSMSGPVDSMLSPSRSARISTDPADQPLKRAFGRDKRRIRGRNWAPRSPFDIPWIDDDQAVKSRASRPPLPRQTLCHGRRVRGEGLGPVGSGRKPVRNPPIDGLAVIGQAFRWVVLNRRFRTQRYAPGLAVLSPSQQAVRRRGAVRPQRVRRAIPRTKAAEATRPEARATTYQPCGD